MDLLRELMHRTRGIRRLGSAAADPQPTWPRALRGLLRKYRPNAPGTWPPGVLLVARGRRTVSGFARRRTLFDEGDGGGQQQRHPTRLLECISTTYWSRWD